MSRRGRSGPTISLFSFQDIITSVTAIVTVITLLLALDLVQRKQSKASDSSSAMAVILTERLERAEEELARLQNVADTTDAVVREVASISPGDLRSEIAQRESTIEELKRERAQLQQQNLVWKAHEKAKLTEQFDLVPLKDEQTRTSVAATELERQQAEEAAENRTIYSLPRGTKQEGWLAVVDADQIDVAPIGRAAPPTTFVPTGLALIGSSAADNFGKWMDEKNLDRAYFLVLIRPGGAATFDDVEEKLKSRRISHGFDLIDADQAILHPERGAAP